ncbi:MAG: glycosyl transferase [Actinomycetota bacterium]
MKACRRESPPEGSATVKAAAQGGIHPDQHQFCTLFDSNYLTRAVTMYRSLEEHCPAFHLTCVCFDDRAKELLDLLRLPQLSSVGLWELEASDPSLLSIKSDRTAVEYCWTSTPALPLFLFKRYANLSRVTYLDADLFFFSDPQPLFEEMGDNSVLITPHRFAPEYRHRMVNGIYNVQFVSFRRDGRGLTCLRWWHDRCIEWCYARPEQGKLGDQKYLDDWPERFEGVHVLEHKGGGLAPWNASSYNVRAVDGRVFVDEDPLVFHHFHGLRIFKDRNRGWKSRGYRVPLGVRHLVYEPYLVAFERVLEEVRSVAPGFCHGMAERANWRDRLSDRKSILAGEVARFFPVLARLRRKLAD